MSIEIIVEVMEHSPKNLTGAERCALLILAEDARLPSREIKHDIDDEYLLQRLQLSAASWSNTRSSLQRKKVLEKISGGHNGKRARYRIPILDEAMKVNRSGEATDGSSSTDSVELQDELVNRSGESRSTESVDLTYITPVTPTTTPGAGEGGGPSANSKTGTDRQAEAVALVAALPAANQPGRGDHTALVAAVAELLALDWPAANLSGRLTWTVTPDVRSVGRVQLKRLPSAAPYPARASPGTAPPGDARPDWCGKCSGRVDRIADGDFRPQSCPACGTNPQPPRSDK